MPNRAERRAAAKASNSKAAAKAPPPKATREIPPDVRARIAAAQGQTPPQAPPINVEQPQAQPQEGDLPPLPPEGLPDHLKDALAGMGGLPGADGAQSGALPSAPKQRRAKRYLALERELAVILTLPAPMFGHAGDQYCEMHFVMQGPAMAAALVHYAESHDGFFALLARAVEAGGIFTLAIAVASYALPPMIHHGLPAPEPVRAIFNVPGRERKATPAEQEAAAAEAEQMKAQQSAPAAAAA